MKKSITFILFTLLFVNACSYPVKPVSMPAVNIYSSYDEKIPGTWIVVIDDDVNNISREITASSYICSAHKYPIEVGDAISTSVKRTLRSIFENTVERKSVPTTNDLLEEDAYGSVFIKLENLDPKLRCFPGFWSASCTATSDVEIGVVVRGREGKLFACSVGDSSTVDGDAGGACGAAADVLAESVSESVQETLERLGERLSNSPKIREYTKKIKQK